MEGFSQPLQVNLSLKKLSATTIAICLCKHPDVKKKIRKSISNKKKDKNFPSNGVRNGVVEVVLKNLETLKLPENLKGELEDMMILLADEITRWIKYVTDFLRLSITYTDKIYWTQFGMIDDFQIYKKFWLNDHNFVKLKDGILSLSLACIHVDEELIKESIDDMIRKSEKFCHPVKIQTEDQTVNIIGLYLHNSDMGGLYDVEQENDGENKNDTEEKLDISSLFQLCVSQAFVRAAKYFYNLLNEKEKRKEIIKAAEECLEQANYCESTDLHERKNAELLLWLINTMPVEQRHYFLMENIDGIIDIFLVSLPYQEIALKVLDEKWVDLITSKHRSMIEGIIHSSNTEHLAKSASSRKVFQEAFRKMLKMASKKVKEDTFVNSKYNLEDCFDAFDVKFLSLIINDKDLENFRGWMIEEANTKIKALIKSKNFELVADFILEVLVSNNERRNFIKKYELLEKLLMCENLKTVEQILNFLISSCDDTITPFITRLNERDMCNRFLEKGRRDLVDKYLDWYYQEKKALVKKSLSEEWSLCIYIFKIWATESNVEEAKKKTLNFLKSIFNSDGEINAFVKGKLIKENDAVVLAFCQDVSKSCKGKNVKENDYAKKFDNIDELLKFCSKTSKDIKYLKKIVADDIKRYWEILGTEDGDFMTLKSLVNWVYSENKSQKEKVITDYLNSTEGVKFLNAMRESVDVYGWEPFLNYLNTWHKSFSNAKKMRKEMRPLDEVVFPAQVMGKLSALILSTGYTQKYTVEHTKGLMAAASDFGYKIYIPDEFDADF